MKHTNYKFIEAEVPKEEAKSTTVRWLISKKDGAPNFAMRLFEIGEDGCSPYHQHEWEHEVFVLAGKGSLRTENGERPLLEGDVVFVEPMEWHQFRNAGKKPFRFICVVPNYSYTV